MTEPNESFVFETDLPVTIFIRPTAEPRTEWVEFEVGPGRISIPVDHEVYLRARNIDDDELYALVKAVKDLVGLTTLNLAENRKITDEGLTRLLLLPRLTHLNLSSCSITNRGLATLTALKKLEHLNISYCNRVSDDGLKQLKLLNRLAFLDIQRCVKTSHAGVKRIERRGLTIHR